MKIPIRQAFQKQLQRQYSLRLHMFAILLATTLSGILSSKILLLFNVVDFRIRYPIAVAFSYLVFFVCIKLWLSLISSLKESKTSVSDWLDLPAPSVQSAVEKVLPSIHGGGGEFFGAGVSGSFEGPDVPFVKTTVLSDTPPNLGEGHRKVLVTLLEK